MKKSILAGLGVVFACGCGGTSAPAGKGDDVIVDVDATTTMEETAEGSTAYGYTADGASVGPSDAGMYGTLADAYAVPSVCATTCVCEAGTFCFAGGSSSPAFSGTCDNASGYGVGCDPLPPNVATCGDLLSALVGKVSCTPRCIPANGMTVLCD
jgi:hypothetical protein